MKNYNNKNYNRLTSDSTSSSASSNMYIKDWRTALRSPPSYRIGNRTIRFQIHFLWILASLLTLVLIFFYIKPTSNYKYYENSGVVGGWMNNPQQQQQQHITSPKTLENLQNNYFYNYTYPLSSPIISNGIRSFRIGLIADLDTNSKTSEKDNLWKSYLKKGYLSFNPTKRAIVVSWDNKDPTEMSSSFSLKGRGMELSELVVFNGRLLTFDDRTGFIYEILNDHVIPWIILIDGNGQTDKGFKSEWATVKDRILYVGSMGKEWTTSSGEFENINPMYVKAVNVHGEVQHINWEANYKKLRSAIDIQWPGYMIHESGVWSDDNKRWYFLPRRCSKDRYNETKDEFMGCNVLLSADENFTNVDVLEIKSKTTQRQATHGYASFKFLPGTKDEVIIALSTEELNGKTSSFISAFTIKGEILFEEEKIPTNYKYEGFEFI
uniref:Apyrase n=1 Tax=Corethrella appendiculata TaxID=1370023 RepID=U5EG83_9DIPT